MAESRFVVTDVGLDAGMLAEEKGLTIKIVKFALGTGVDYLPVPSDTALHGVKVYEGKPYKYRYLSSKSKLIICELPPEAGPFEFGEIALYTEAADGSDVLFALCSFKSLIQKYSSLESKVATSATFNCILTVDEGTATITIDYEDNPQNSIEIEVLDTFAEVKSPEALHYSDLVQEVIINEIAPDGRQTLLTRNYLEKTWSVASTWEVIARNPSIAVATEFYIDIPSSVIIPELRSNGLYDYLIQIDNNTFRRATLSTSTNRIRFTWVDAVEDITGNSHVTIFYPASMLGDYVSNISTKIDNLENKVKGEYVTLGTSQTITGAKTFTQIIYGTAQYAQWADLAEVYEADAPYKPGTLLCFGGDKEVTVALNFANCVVSTRPGYLLNSSGLEDTSRDMVPVALTGRVPVRVVGSVKKHARIYLSNIPGVGTADNFNAYRGSPFTVIGVALESVDVQDENEEHLVMCAVNLNLGNGLQ